jgi:preprotein translocase subunit SecA
MATTTKFGLGRVLTGLFGTKHDRDMRPLRPIVEAVHAASEPLAALTEEQLRGKTDEFRSRLAAGETVDDLMVEAFAVVKEACRRNVGRSWSVVGRETTWDMVPFDVQLIGALVLHQGKIAEMATGEGKTLVAVMPLYLNALPGKGCHLVTVNDYLARRDSEWMGAILRYLGLTVGVIEHDLDNARRRAAYACDITYGTNNEFGFDYLRDNMAVRQEDQVQRGHHYAIVDEVDSVLVDEARTPLIISGPVAATHQRYDALRDPVESLVRAQTRLVGELLNEAERELTAANAGTGKGASDSEYAAGVALLQAQRAAPKNNRFLKLIAERNLKELIHRVETDYMRDKQLHRVDEELYFSIDEREHSINLSDKGRGLLRPGDPDYFMLPDLAEAVGRVDADESLDAKQKIAAKQEIHLRYAAKSDELHTIHQLLRAFCLYDRDGEYVVQEDKVLIVDEFTGRLMPGRRYSDGLHQALEAKERVRVEGETQTWATITLQNYFRLYTKLAGMTGTAETEAGEFWQIYKLDVIVVPTNEAVRRVDYDDLVYRTRREKYNAIIDEIARVHEQGRPVLVGTVSVEASETISRMLRRRGIEHSVLNAKFHQQEAEIVAGAGRPGAVTIATNMAGRGTDIKLGPGVRKGRKCLVRSPEGVGDCQATESADACEADMPCGLHIIGTERHESRRIDRQLRGRSGRQGDPGASRFFISFEDDLMRLFGSERVGALMDRMGAREGEAIEHPLVTKAIERAQKRVEEHNFSIRKHLLEYDDVMTQQREVIYGIRKQILAGESIREEILSLFEMLIARKLEAAAPAPHSHDGGEGDASRLQEACEELERIFLVPFPLASFGAAPAKARSQTDASPADDPLVAEALRIAREAYQAREDEWGEAAAREVERQVYLRVIDDHWKDHLYEIDILRSGIGLRSYGQKDPLLEYKGEAFQMFETLMGELQEETLKLLFRVQLRREPAPPPPPPRPSAGEAMHASASGFAAASAAPPAAASAVSPTGTPMRESASGEAAARRGKTPVRSMPKVGRNDPCPCGSGRKYKHCHGTQPE